ncbi:hypothetical protein, partial [Streptococcus minor]|uniref:hypothetical protein n=1 Tax=Streptococcus minor TaxID=229549 RepID=UPI001C8A418E
PASYYAAFGPHAAVYRPSPSYVGGYYGGGSAGQYAAYQQQQAQANGQSTYNWGKSKSKEARNIHRNWTLALEETQKHVCDPKRMKAGDKSSIRPSKKQLQDLQERISKDDKTAILQLIKGS